VARRTREIGIRMSLGASRAAVLLMVFRQAIAQTLAGAVAGMAGALALGRLMIKLLYGVQPGDPLTFGGVAFVLVAAALIATYLPARRASRIDPRGVRDIVVDDFRRPPSETPSSPRICRTAGCSVGR
jgi:ABC-type antimicrobial peptide transport system permease subunit